MPNLQPGARRTRARVLELRAKLLTQVRNELEGKDMWSMDGIRRLVDCPAYIPAALIEGRIRALPEQRLQDILRSLKMPSAIVYDYKAEAVQFSGRKIPFKCGYELDPVAAVLLQLHFQLITPQEAYDEIKKCVAPSP